MKKIIFIIIILIMTGCKNDTSAKEVVSNYLNSYTNYTKDVEYELDKIVINDLDLSK